MQYITQSPHDLRIIFTDDLIDINQFSVVSERNYVHEQYAITFGILTESHFVTIERAGLKFSEICACSDISISGVEDRKLDTQSCSLTQKYDQLAYSFEHLVTSFADGEHRLSALHEKRSRPDTEYLAHSFPTNMPGEMVPVTEIYISFTDLIQIESIHTYPDCDAMVFTTSTITL